MLFTTVNKRPWRIEVVDQLRALVKLSVFRPNQNQETFESAFPQLSRGSNKATWTRKQIHRKLRPISGSQRDMYLSYLPTPPLGQDVTQGQFLSGV